MENQEDQEEIKPAPRRKWKRWVCLAVLLIIGPTQYLNHTGFCYAEMQYLSERELVDRFLFGDQADVMGDEEKISFVAKKWNGANYPECCVLDYTPFDLRFLRDVTNKIFAGWYIMELDAYFPKDKVTELDYIYYHRMFKVDQCGTLRDYGYGEGLKLENYENKLERNKLYWTDKEKQNGY